MTDLPFSQSEIDSELDRLQVTKTQKQLMADMGEALGDALDLPVQTMRGFYAMSVIDWQKQIDMTAAETETKMSTMTSSRVNTAVQILAIVRAKVLPVVRLHGKEHLLDGAISAALDLYTKRYASRPPDSE